MRQVHAWYKYIYTQDSSIIMENNVVHQTSLFRYSIINKNKSIQVWINEKKNYCKHDI